MGGLKPFKTSKSRGGPLGKIDAPLNKKLQQVKWGTFRLGDLFEILSYQKRFDANKVCIQQSGKYPYIVRTAFNNGQKGYIDANAIYLNEGNTISFGQDTATAFYQPKPYFTGDKIKVLKSKNKKFSQHNALFFVAAITKSFSLFSWGESKFDVGTLEEQLLRLPMSPNGSIDFEFIAEFVAELEAQRVAELEAQRVAELATYLQATGLKDYTLTEEEQNILKDYNEWNWGTFNLETLFGKSTRGKRLKSADRISGELPFVTAGEANEGISDFIGNSVEIFEANTTTIDMFGSAKYRNYKYGGDDHIAVVHTEGLPKHAAIFVTTAIHKSSHNGQFDYSNNFYASDADVLNIVLPVKNSKPDYKAMELLISAIHKLVIKDVVEFADRKITITRKVIN